VTHAGGEHNGYCRRCLEDVRKGGDLPVCRHAEATEDGRFCAWCGHAVTR
jgi:hypothetical protein